MILRPTRYQVYELQPLFYDISSKLSYNFELS